MIERSEFFIGGKWRPAESGRMAAPVINPSDESELGTVPEAVVADIEAAVQAARTAFDSGDWRRASVEERIEAVVRLGALVEKRADELIHLVVSEMGAPISGTGSVGQVLGVPVVIDVFAAVARTFVWSETRKAPGEQRHSIVVREPVGVVGAIIPWNGPLMLAAMKIAPALIAGCTVVLKPAPETALDSYVLAELAMEAGIPEGVINIVPGGRDVGEYLVRHPAVDKITFTGSTAAGRSIGSICGQDLRRVSLELGGKSAAIVLDDADLDVALPALIAGGLGNNGQQCFALSRVIVSPGRKRELVDALAGEFTKMRVGHALDPETALGPLITSAQRGRVEGYIAKGQSEGATLVCGGGRPADLDRGWYVEPTLFSDVDNGSIIAQEEIFGPVISVITAEDEQDAIAKANDSIYGLGGAIFTSDVSHGIEVAREVRTGTFHINSWGGNLAAPFGGFKASGIGREWGPEGIADCTELKTINLPAAV